MPDSTKRRKAIDKALEGAEGRRPPKKKERKANPYPKDSYRYKLFERKLREAQSTDSNQ